MLIEHLLDRLAYLHDYVGRNKSSNRCDGLEDAFLMCLVKALSMKH